MGHAASPLAFARIGSAAIAQTAPVNGEVTKIEEAQGKITLKHRPIKNRDMESTTMVFRVRGPAMLKTVKVGEKVTFEADRVNGAVTVSKIQKANVAGPRGARRPAG